LAEVGSEVPIRRQTTKICYRFLKILHVEHNLERVLVEAHTDALEVDPRAIA